MRRRSGLARLNRVLQLGLVGTVPLTLALAQARAADGAPAEPVAAEGASSPAQAPSSNLAFDLDDAPVSVTALSDDAPGMGGIDDLKGLAAVTPGLIVTSAMNESPVAAYMRGIGSTGTNAGLEPSVGLFIDGIPRPYAAGGFGDFVGIDRIEIFTGPQGALFGANSSAGAINVMTRRPVHERTFAAAFTAGDFGALGAAASFSTGISDSVAVRLDLATRRRDGFLDVMTGNGPRLEDEDTDQDAYAFRGQLLFEPTSRLDINLSVDFSSRDENCCAAVTLVRGASAGIIDTLAPDSGVAPIADPFARVAWSNRSTAQTIDDVGGDIQIGWDTGWLGNARLTSITSLRRWEAVAGADLDFSTADLFYREPTEADDLTRAEAFTQELRFEGATDSFDWRVGVSYLHEDLDRNEGHRIGAGYERYLSIEMLRRINPALTSSPTAPLFMSQAAGRPFGTVFAGHAAADQYRQRATSLSLFTDNTWHVTDAFDVTLRFRYTFDDKELTSAYSNPNGGVGCRAMLANPAQVVSALVARGLTVAQASARAPQVHGLACAPWTNGRHDARTTEQSIDSEEWSGSLKAAYRFDERVMVYVSASRDYRPAGFSFDRVQSNNGLPTGTAGLVPVDDTSFAAETVEGYELGIRTNWLDGALQLNATLFHQRHTDSPLQMVADTGSFMRTIPETSSTGIEAQIAWSRGGFSLRSGLIYADTSYGDDALADSALALLPGNRPGFAPKWSFTGAVGYEWQLSDNLSALVDVGFKHVSDYNTGYDLNPLKVQDAFTLVNARIALAQSDGAWAIELWGQNLTDADYLVSSFDVALQPGAINAFLGAPRTFGVTLRLDL